MAEYKVPITQGKTDSMEDWGTTNSRFVNWVIDDQGAIHPRPAIVQIDGLSLSSSGAQILGCYVWRSPVDLQTYIVYVLSDRRIRALNPLTLVTTNLSSSSAATKLAGGASRVTFTEDSLRVIIAGGGALQQWTGTGLSSRLDSAAVTTANQPPTGATHVTALANYIISNDYVSGSYSQFKWSNLGDGAHTTWNPLNFNTADASPDRVVGVYSSLQELYVFGEKTLQVYGTGGDQYLPFVTAAALAVGCVAPYSPVQLEDKFAWLDDRRRFVISDGRSFEVISSPVEKTIRDLSTVEDCWGARIQVAFYDILIWVFPSADLCLSYDMKKQTWGTWESLTPTGKSEAPRIGSVTFWAGSNTTYIGDSDFENLFQLDPTATQDVGSAPIACDLITNRDDYGSANLKQTRRVTAYIKRGQGWEGGRLEIAVRDDDVLWRQFSELNLGAPGDYLSSLTWYPGGVFRRRQYRLRYSGSAEMAVSGITETFDPRGR